MIAEHSGAYQACGARLQVRIAGSAGLLQLAHQQGLRACCRERVAGWGLAKGGKPMAAEHKGRSLQRAAEAMG